MVERFNWILDGELAGMAQPGLFATMEEDLTFLKEAGVEAICTLTEYELPQKFLDPYEMVGKHIPVEDFKVPKVDQVLDFCDWVDEQLAAKRPVAVHCYAGVGRTGTFLACYLVKRGMGNAIEIIDRIRQKEPGYVQTPQQEAFVAVFQGRLEEMAEQHTG